MSDKTEAERLADEAGNEIGKADPQWEVIDAAIEMLRRWPDGEPVMCPGRPDSHCNYDAHCGRVCNKCGRVHDGKPAESERIAALEAALEQARVALEVASSWLAAVPNAMASGAYGGVLSALRAIEEVR